MIYVVLLAGIFLGSCVLEDYFIHKQRVEQMRKDYWEKMEKKWK